MIKVNVIAVGKLKEKYLREACNEYVKRLGAFSKVSVVEVSEERCSDNPSPSEIETVKDKEGKRIIAKILKSSFVIPLCIEGTQYSSEDFSKKIEAASVSGVSDITFIMTLPHQLMRVVLLEQVYRAFSISNNGKYHK
mgnify:CR=1 FL=1